VTGKTLIINWGLRENTLFHYMVVDDRNSLIKEGYLPLNVSKIRVRSLLKGLSKTYGVEKAVVENHIMLSSVKKKVEGYTSADTNGWLRKLRAIDESYNYVKDALSGVPLMTIDSYPDDYMNGFKEPVGRFIEITENGLVKFKNASVKIPKTFLEFASMIFEASVVPSFSILKKAKDDSIVIVRKEDKAVRLEINLLNGDPIIIETDIKDEDLDDKYIYIWMHREFDGNYMASVVMDRTEKAAYKAYRREVMNEMIRWINNYGEVGFIFGLINMPLEKASHYAQKYREKYFK